MSERSRSGLVVTTSLLIGVVFGVAAELATPFLSGFLGVSDVVIFGLGLGIVEGPTLVASIVLTRRVTRMWVRSALEATAPFLGFFAYLVAYGVSRHPPFTFPF